MVSITCPSGLSGEIRGLKVKEMNLLSSRRSQRGQENLNKVIANCWLETHSPGPYPENKAVDWVRVLQGDRLYVLVQLRIITLGPEYAFHVVCDRCKHNFEWSLDLNDLPVQKLSERGRDAYLADNRLEAQIDGRKVFYKLLTGYDDKHIATIQEEAETREDLLTSMIAYRTWEIEGIDAAKKKAFIDDLGWASALKLLDEFDSTDCGINTAIEVRCPRCYSVQEIELPLERHFFMTKRSRRSEKTDSERESSD